MNDKQLRQHVIDELDFEPSIDSADIGVLAEEGVVTLTGHVPSYVQKTAAERATWRVKGVKAVVQNIIVRYPRLQSSDEEIAKRAIELLAWDSSVPDGIRVTVDRGWLTLEGQVSWQFERSAAEKGLRHLIGVTGITNNITLKSIAQVSTVKRCIEEALKRNAEIQANQIRVEIKDGRTVTLEGKVDNWSERAAVEHAVWSAPGVSSVVDNLTIG